MFIHKSGRRIWSFAAPVLILAALLLAFMLITQGLGGSTQAESLKLAKESIRRAAVQCYALEGEYAPSYEYLKENYGVSADETRYRVDYVYVAANLMPDITIVPLQH